MKAQAFFAVFAVSFLFVAGCSSTERSGALRPREEAQIRQEVTEAFATTIKNWETMNVDLALQAYAPTFSAFGMSGVKHDLEAYRRSSVDGFKNAIAYKWTPYSLEFLLITKDAVVCAYDARNEITRTSGDTLKIDPSHYTFILKKVAGRWQLTYHHFSGTFSKERAKAE